MCCVLGGEKLVWQKAQVIWNRILQTANNVFGKLWNGVSEKCFHIKSVSQPWCCRTMKMWKYWWAIISCSILKVKPLVILDSQRQRIRMQDTHQMHTVIDLEYCPNDNGKKLTRVLNQRLYVNAATQVSVYSPAHPSPAKSWGILWPWFLSVTCVHLNYCLCVMQGKNRHAMRSGCALWLIVKCCPGAHCQTPLNGLHSRKQSVAVTKGLVGTGPVMIDLQWISEDVSENWASPESCSGQRECPQTWTCGITSTENFK